MNWLFWSRDPRKRTGAVAEDVAAEFLRAGGASIRSRHFQCPLGEMDIIAEDRGAIAFVEVKSSSAAGGPEPELRVGAAKRRTLVRVAEYYLQRNGLTDRPARFDVVAVTFSPDGTPPRVVHYRDAFAADE